MARKGFHSFCWDDDQWRAAKIRGIGVLEGDQIVKDNDWEKVRKGGPENAKRWINEQMVGKSVVIVLIGVRTVTRDLVRYEIEKGWNDGKGVLGVHIHKILDRLGKQSAKGTNPFSRFKVDNTPLSSIAKTYDPPQTTSSGAYSYIEDSLNAWVEEAIRIRKSYSPSAKAKQI